MTDTTKAQAPSVDEVSELLDAMYQGRVAAARFRQLFPGEPPVEPATNLAPLVGELRTLLRSWTHFNDTTLVTLTQDLLRYYGQWDDDDHDAADARRSNFGKGVAEDDLAYDGWSNEPQKRDLTARERDMLTRIIRDALRPVTGRPGSEQDTVLSGLMDGYDAKVTVYANEIDTLINIQHVLDARHD